MTYCLALRADDGLVFLADTRTNAGLDNISSYRKLHVFQPAPDRLFVLESAGSLATTQQVLDRICTDLAAPVETESLLSVGHLHEAALYVGRLNREVADQHRPALDRVGADPSATFILGGQLRGAGPELFLVHAEGNYIRVSDERPYLQIGESKYGKFLLDAAVASKADLVTASKVAVGSMMATARANLSVGPPYDLAIYRNDSFRLDQYRIEADSPLLGKLEEVWQRHMISTIRDLPTLGPDDVTWVD